MSSHLPHRRSPSRNDNTCSDLLLSSTFPYCLEQQPPSVYNFNMATPLNSFDANTYGPRSLCFITRQSILDLSISPARVKMISVISRQFR
jgi:hypothetical protein